MSDAAPSLNLHSLEQDLQNRLHAEPANTQPVQVRCVFKEGILIVLVQHGSPALPYPRRVFRSIRQFLLESNVLDQHQVLMYLRVEGTNQPYAFHTLTEQSAAPTPVSEEENEPVAESEPIEDLTAEAEEEFDDGYEDEEDIADFEEPAFAIADEDEEEDEELDSIGGFEVEPDDELDDDYDEDEDIGFEGFTSFEDGEADDYAGDEVGDRRLSKATMAFAACLALAFSGTAFYVLTRPCVIDGCQTMSNADQLGDKSLKTFQGNPSGQEILTAQEQLDQTIDQLESIPFWSPRYTEAQSKLKDYRELSGSLDKIIESLFKASGAAQMSQNPPFPSEKWTEIAMEWETAIAGLSEIPPQDFYHSFAQSKIDGYEQNLKAINQRLAMEENSVVTLAEAKEDAKAAEVQQGVAQTLDSWEQAYLSWSAAIQKLESIPAGTTAYEEAQKLIVTYEPQMTDSKKTKITRFSPEKSIIRASESLN